MSSKAVANFILKGLDEPQNRATDVGVSSVLKKKWQDATFSLAFNDATLRDPRSGKGVIVAAEKKIGDGVKAGLAYDLGKRDTIATLTVDRTISGNDLSLKAIYKKQGDVLLLEESWKFDKHNKLSGTYNFKDDAGTITYTYSQGDWTAEGKYDFAREAPTLSIKKREGPHTLQAVYGVKDEIAVLSWEKKPFKLAIKGKASRKSGMSGLAAVLTATHEFDL